MIISEILAQARSLLEKDLTSDVTNAKLDSLILLAYAISISGTPFSKDQVLLNLDLDLTPQQEQIFFELVQRRIKREPVSHIIGKREFFGTEFKVTSDVLDPRPDSETLIELVQKRCSQTNKTKFSFLELGVGSGCLTITLLKLYPQSNATAVDISKKAIKICQDNANNQQIEQRLSLIESNLFDNLKTQKFDLIISNPPYIPSQDIEKLEPEVKIYEPIIALDGGKDGLDFYRQIAKQAKEFLSKEGEVIIEIGYGQKDDIVEIFAKNNFNLIDCHLDLASIARSLCFKIKN